MRVVPVPVLSDNYAYLLIDRNGVTAAVDPVEPAKVMQAATEENVVVSSILTTHHHWSERKLKGYCLGHLGAGDCIVSAQKLPCNSVLILNIGQECIQAHNCNCHLPK